MGLTSFLRVIVHWVHSVTLLICCWVLSHFFIVFWGKGPYWLAHHQFFLEHWALLIRSTSLDPQSQNRDKCAPLWPICSDYILENIYSQYSENMGNKLGNWWKHIRNKEKQQKTSPSRLQPKRKKVKAPWAHANLFTSCMQFLFSKLFLTIFGLG